MGIVYKAEDPAIGRTLAIKTIRLGDVGDVKERTFLRDRLFREARSAGILSHPNIVTIYDVQEHGEMAYVFMEFVDGPSLEKVMAKSALEPEGFLRLVDQTAAALDYAHSRGIVHRDIKPANIMLSSDGGAKITDFGVAKIASAQATQTGVVMGTPSYMSPEQIADKPLDGRSDQFSLAVIVYQLLTGEKPFAAPTLPSLMFKIVNDKPAPPQRLNPTLSPAVELVLNRAMEKDPTARYPQCADFSKALAGACRNRAGWKLMNAGATENMATVAGSASVVEPTVPTVAPVSTPAPPPPVFKPDQSGSGSLNIPSKKGGWLGPGIAMALGVLLIGGMGWIGYRLLFTNDPPKTAEQAPPPVTAQDTKAAAKNERKPSAIGPASGSTPAPPDPAKQTAAAPPTVTPPAKPEAPQQLKSVEVRITTTPPGAKIEVEGAAPCTSPCEPLLPAGSHRVLATLAGYKNAVRVVNVPQELEMDIPLERASGTVSVTSNPAGGTIFVDGQARKEKTPASLSLPAGKHRIEVHVEGFGKDGQDADVREGSFLRVDFTWKTN